MSVVVAIKANGGVYLASDTQVSAGQTKTYLTNENNYKAWKYPDVQGVVVGGTGNAYTMEIVQTGEYFRDVDIDRIDYRWLVQYFLPELLTDLVKFEDLEVSELGTLKSGADLFIAIKDRIYSLRGETLFIAEESEYSAMGSGYYAAIASLDVTKGESLKKRLLKAVLAASEYDYYVSGPVVILNTLNNDMIVVEDPLNEILHGDDELRPSKGGFILPGLDKEETNEGGRGDIGKSTTEAGDKKEVEIKDNEVVFKKGGK